MKDRCKLLWEKSRITLLIVLIACFISAGIEGAYHIKTIQASRSMGKYIKYGQEELDLSGMSWDGENAVAQGEEGRIRLYPNGGYVDKLMYSYGNVDEDAVMDATVQVTFYNVYGNEQVETISDKNPYVIHQSIVNIRNKVKEICIIIPAGTAGLEISDICIVNSPRFNVRRWLYFAAILFLILMLWKYRYYFAGKVEGIFLLMGITAGTALVIILPLNKIGFDEETHFRNAYDIKLSSSVSTTEAIQNLKEVTLDNWPFNLAQSAEERELMEEYYAQAGDYRSKSAVSGIAPTHISTMSAYNYIFMALGIKIGKLLQLPFTAVYTLGRLFNLWMYLMAVYFAIKKLPFGKYIMAVLALMPTPLFQASVYSADAVVTGFVYLGLAYLIAELSDTQHKLTIKNGLIMLGSLGFGMVPKAVYFPLMALPFLLKKEKFADRKQKFIFRIANVVCILGLWAVIVIPMLINPATVNDVRGGAVDALEQLKLVLHHPLGYLNVWLHNVADTFWSYGFGEGSLGALGHVGVSTCIPMIGLLLIFVIVTENVDRSDADLTFGHKAVFFAAAVLSLACVWGSLYLAFNEVGATHISGVQGRYMVPLLFVFYLLLRRKRIKNGMKLVNYNFLVFGCTGFIIMKTMYDCFLQPFCF